MAGLGTNFGTSFTLRAEMDGFPSIGGTNVPVWYFSADGVPRGFMNDRVLPSAAASVTAQIDYLDDHSGAVLGSVQTRVQVA